MTGRLLKKFVCAFVAFCFFLNSSGFAQVLPSVILSKDIGQSPLLKYLSVNEENPNNYFNFIMDRGSRDLPKSQLDSAAKELVSFFFLGITIPDSSFWVNLRPDEPERITSEVLSRTDIGRVLLEQDLLLKKTVSAYLHPQHSKGKEFWSRLYEKIGENKVNKTEITTSNRVWIVPDEVIVVQTADGAYIAKARLKVLLENEYLKKNPKDNPQAISENLMKEIILPALAEDVNENPEFSKLRQVYYSLILAQWFKRSHKKDIAAYSAAIDKGDIKGLESQLPWSKQAIWQEYLQSYNNGEYKVKGALSGLSRMYFSGGVKFNLGPGASSPLKIIPEDQFVKDNPEALWLADNNNVIIEGETSPDKISSNGLGVSNQVDPEISQEAKARPGVFRKSFYRGLNLALGSLVLASGVVILNNLSSPEYSSMIQKAGWGAAFLMSAFSMPWLKNGIKTRDSSNLGWKKTFAFVLAITAFGAFNYYYTSGNSKILHDARKSVTTAVATTVKVAQAVNKDQNKFAIQGQRNIDIGLNGVKIDMVKFKVGGLIPGKMEVYSVDTKNFKVDMVAGKEINEGGLASRDDFLRSRPGSVLSTSLSYYKVEKGEGGKLVGLPTAGFKTNGKSWNGLAGKSTISTDGILGILPDGSVKIVSLDTIKSGKFSLDKMTSYVQMGPVVMEGGKNVLKYPNKGERGLMLFAVTKDGKFLIAPSEVLKGVYGLSYSEAFTLLEEWGKKSGVKIESAIFADGGSRQGVTFPMDALSILGENDFKDLTNTIPFTDNIGSLVFSKNDGSSSPIAARLSQESIRQEKLWSQDKNFLSVVDYFNTTVLSQDRISWENVVNLYSKLMGEDTNAGNVRKLNELRIRSAAERGKSLKSQDLSTLITHNINAAARIIPGFTGGVLELANSKINSEGRQQKDIDNNVRDIATWIYTEIVSGPQFFYGLRGFGDAGGHNRVAWFIMNYFLVKNGYEPFYFKDSRQYNATVQANTWAIRDLVGASSPVKRNNFVSEIPFKRIFYVDDRYTFRAAVSDYIQQQFPGAKVFTAGGLAQARRTIETQAPFDLVITDLTMGEDLSDLNVEAKEGGRLVSYIRQGNKNPKVPIMILSASVKGNEKKLKSLGADYFVDKNSSSGFLEGLRSGIADMAKKSASSPLGNSLSTEELSKNLTTVKNIFENLVAEKNLQGVRLPGQLERAYALALSYGVVPESSVKEFLAKRLGVDRYKTTQPYSEKILTEIDSAKKMLARYLNGIRSAAVGAGIVFFDMAGHEAEYDPVTDEVFLRADDVFGAFRLAIHEEAHRGQALAPMILTEGLADYIANKLYEENPDKLMSGFKLSRQNEENFVKKVINEVGEKALLKASYSGLAELSSVLVEDFVQYLELVAMMENMAPYLGLPSSFNMNDMVTEAWAHKDSEGLIKRVNKYILGELKSALGGTEKLKTALNSSKSYAAKEFKKASSPVESKDIQSPLIETLEAKGFNVGDFQNYIRELINNEIIDGVVIWGNVTSPEFIETRPRVGVYLLLRQDKRYSSKPMHFEHDVIALNGIEEGIKSAINGAGRFEYNITQDLGSSLDVSTVQFFDQNSLLLLSNDFVSDKDDRLKRLDELNKKISERKVSPSFLNNIYSLGAEGWNKIGINGEALEFQAPAGVSLKNTDASSSPVIIESGQSGKLSKGEPGMLQAHLAQGICLAVVVFNRETGETALVHFSPGEHILPRYNRSKDGHIKIRLGDIKGLQWQALVVSSQKSLNPDYISAKDLADQLIENGINEKNILRSEEDATRSVAINSDGYVTLMTITEHGSSESEYDLSEGQAPEEKISAEEGENILLEMSLEVEEIRDFFHDVRNFLNLGVFGFANRIVRLIERYGFNSSVEGVQGIIDNLKALEVNMNAVDKDKEARITEIKEFLSKEKSIDLEGFQNKKETIIGLIKNYYDLLEKISLAINGKDGVGGLKVYLEKGVSETDKGIEGYKKIMSAIETCGAAVINSEKHLDEFSNERVHLQGDMNKFLGNYVSSLQHFVKDIEIRYHGPQGSVMVNFNEYSLRTILDNIAMNAIIHGFKGRDKQAKKIDISLELGESAVEIRIKDNGNGIQEDKQNEIFERGYTTGGTGLGLSSVTRKIRENYGGNVEVENSGLGIGSTFKLTIPNASSPVEAGKTGFAAPVINNGEALEFQAPAGVSLKNTDASSLDKEIERESKQEIAAAKAALGKFIAGLPGGSFHFNDVVVQDYGNNKKEWEAAKFRFLDRILDFKKTIPIDFSDSFDTLDSSLTEIISNAYDAVVSYYDQTHLGGESLKAQGEIRRPEGYAGRIWATFETNEKEEVIIKIFDNGMGKFASGTAEKQNKEFFYLGNMGMGISSHVASFIKDVGGSFKINFQPGYTEAVLVIPSNRAILKDAPASSSPIRRIFGGANKKGASENNPFADNMDIANILKAARLTSYEKNRITNFDSINTFAAEIFDLFKKRRHLIVSRIMEAENKSSTDARNQFEVERRYTILNALRIALAVSSNEAELKDSLLKIAKQISDLVKQNPPGDFSGVLHKWLLDSVNSWNRNMGEYNRYIAENTSDLDFVSAAKRIASKNGYSFAENSIEQNLKKSFGSAFKITIPAASSSPIKENDRIIFLGQDVNAILQDAVASLSASIFNPNSVRLELGSIPAITGVLQDSQKYDQELTAFQIKDDGWAKTLSSVFSHLAHNSGRAKASEMVISSKLSADGDNILIEVSDNGEGIDNSLLDNGNIESIFEKERSFREKPRPDQSGLGLYYSRIMVANQMGGSIDVVRNVSLKDAQGAGSKTGVTFRISLPVDPALAGITKKQEIAGKGGIDLSNIEITLKNEEFVSGLNAADLKILRAAKALNENWDSLAVLYMHELILLLKQNIVSDITQRPALLNILSRLDSRKSLDEETTVFYHAMLS